MIEASPRLDALVSTFFEQIRIFNLASGQHHIDEERLAAFLKRRLPPLLALLHAGDHFGLTFRIPERLPFFYSVAEWPAEAPPAGMIATREIATHTAVQALSGFWFLQCTRGHGVVRLTRGMLWMLDRHGYRGALQFLFDAIISGTVIDWVAGVEVLSSLLQARRQVANDALIFTQFARRVPRKLAEWRDLDVSPPPSARQVRPDLFDDIDWLQAQGTERIEACRRSKDATEWIAGLAEIGLLCVILSQTFRRLGLDIDLAYGSFAAQVEEIQADCGSGFMVLNLVVGFGDEDRLRIPWSMAGAMAVMAKFHDDEWLERIIDQRVLVPDALLDLYYENPPAFEKSVPPAWRVPEPWLRAVLAELGTRDAPYALVPVGAGFRGFPAETLRAEAEARGVQLDSDDIEAITSILRRGHSGETQHYPVLTEVSHIGGIEVPAPTIERLASHTRLEPHQLEDWIRSLYDSITASAGLKALQDLIQGKPGEIATLADYVRIYPNFPLGHAERAIELDRSGQPDRAWDQIAIALAFLPDDVLLWQSASAILAGLGDQTGAALARFMKEYLGSKRD